MKKNEPEKKYFQNLADMPGKTLAETKLSQK
jgi:hypothetical protein